MAAVGDILKVSLRGFWRGKPYNQVGHYMVSDLVGDAYALGWDEILQEWWDLNSDAIRGFPTTGYVDLFQTVRIDVVNAPGIPYAVIDVPSAQRSGTRNVIGEVVPNFTCAAIQLFVGSRVTKQGAKRPIGFNEPDVNGNERLNSTDSALHNYARVWGFQNFIEADTGGITLMPVIASYFNNGQLRATQPVTGFGVKRLLTTQNTRKLR